MEMYANSAKLSERTKKSIFWCKKAYFKNFKTKWEKRAFKWHHITNIKYHKRQTDCINSQKGLEKITLFDGGFDMKISFSFLKDKKMNESDM